MKSEKILVVDDTEELREALVEFIREEGYEVFGAGNGIEALDVLKDGHIDVVLSDIHMPEMDGYKLTKKIKSEYSKTGVIVMTAYTSIYSEGDIRKIGADEFITKPFSFTEVIEKIERVIFMMKSLKPRK